MLAAKRESLRAGVYYFIHPVLIHPVLNLALWRKPELERALVLVTLRPVLPLALGVAVDKDAASRAPLVRPRRAAHRARLGRIPGRGG